MSQQGQRRASQVSAWKVTDEQILAAVWRRMVINSAKGAVTRYVGGRYGLSGDRFRRYGQDCHLISRENLGIALSYGHLRKRIVHLIDSGRMQWATRDCTYLIDCERAQAVWRHATEWWAVRGVPGGWDDENRCMRTTQIDGFDGLVLQLESELLAEFGDFDESQVTP